MCFRKGNPFQGPKAGSRLTLRSKLWEAAHVLTKQETLLGRGAQVESEGKGSQEDCSFIWLTVSCFMVIELVSGLSLAN